MPINHLLRNLENRERRSGDSRPTWLVELIDQAADLFEPMMSVSRVGFDCWPTETDWVVFLFLGDTEIVGGCDDGRLDPLDFRFDLLGLLDLLEREDFQRFIASSQIGGMWMGPEATTESLNESFEVFSQYADKLN